MFIAVCQRLLKCDAGEEKEEALLIKNEKTSAIVHEKMTGDLSRSHRSPKAEVI